MQTTRKLRPAGLERGRWLPESQPSPQLPAPVSTGTPCVTAPHHRLSPGEAQAGAADLKSRHSLRRRLFTHSTVSAKESGTASAGDGNRGCVGFRSHSLEVAVLQLLGELYSWKSLVVQRSRLRDRSLASARDAWSWLRRLCFLGKEYSESSMSVSM